MEYIIKIVVLFVKFFKSKKNLLPIYQQNNFYLLFLSIPIVNLKANLIKKWKQFV